MNQGDLLRHGQKALGLTREKLAAVLDVNARTMNNWYLPPNSNEYRAMPENIREKLEETLANRQAAEYTNWLDGVEAVALSVENRNHASLDWATAKAILLESITIERGAIDYLASPLAVFLAKPFDTENAVLMHPILDRLCVVIDRNPKAFKNKKEVEEQMKKLPPPYGTRRRYKTMQDVVQEFLDRAREAG